MPFIPHTEKDISEMLGAIGVVKLDDLFDEIPATLPAANLNDMSTSMDEYEITRLLTARAPNYKMGSCFIGAGAYEHHIPAAVKYCDARRILYGIYALSTGSEPRNARSHL